MPIDLKEVEYSLKHMTPQDMMDIDVSAITLRRLSQHPERLKYARYDTLEKIERHIRSIEFMDRLRHVHRCHQTEDMKISDVRYIGIDIGTRTHLAASDETRSRTFITEENDDIIRIYEYYHCKLMNGGDRIKAYQKLIGQLKMVIYPNVRDLQKTFRPNHEIVHYVIGTNFINRECINLMHIIWALTVEALMMKKGTHTVTLTSEYTTSIECPRCRNINKENRRKPSNQFCCKRCGFFHEHDDIVAASNIASRYDTEFTLKAIQSMPFRGLIHPDNELMRRGFGHSEEERMRMVIERRRKSC